MLLYNRIHPTFTAISGARGSNQTCRIHRFEQWNVDLLLIFVIPLKISSPGLNPAADFFVSTADNKNNTKLTVTRQNGESGAPHAELTHGGGITEWTILSLNKPSAPSLNTASASKRTQETVGEMDIVTTDVSGADQTVEDNVNDLGKPAQRLGRRKNCLSAVLALLLIAVAVLYRQYAHTLSAVPVPPVPTSLQPSNLTENASDPHRTLSIQCIASEPVFAELRTQQEDLRLLSDQLDSVRPDCRNSSTLAIVTQAADHAAKIHTNAQLLIAKIQDWKEEALPKEQKSAVETLGNKANAHSGDTEVDASRDMLGSSSPAAGTVTETDKSSPQTDFGKQQERLKRAKKQHEEWILSSPALRALHAELDQPSQEDEASPVDASWAAMQQAVRETPLQLLRRPGEPVPPGEYASMADAIRATMKRQDRERAQKVAAEAKGDVNVEAPSSVRPTASSGAAVMDESAATVTPSQPPSRTQEAASKERNPLQSGNTVPMSASVLQAELSQFAAEQEAKNRLLRRLIQNEPQRTAARGPAPTEDLRPQHDYAAHDRGGQVLDHHSVCPAFKGSLLTSPPCAAEADPRPPGREFVGSRFWLTLCSTTRASRHSADAQVLISRLGPVADHYYALNTQHLNSATSTANKVRRERPSSGVVVLESYAGQVTILLQDPVHVASVKLITATAAGAAHIQACAPKMFRLVGWTEDPRTVRDVQGKQFELGTHLFDALRRSRDYDGVSDSDVSASTTVTSDSATTDQVWEQQFAVPIEYEGVTIPALKAVTVHVLSNNGQHEFTCLHRVQIIGLSQAEPAKGITPERSQQDDTAEVLQQASEQSAQLTGQQQRSVELWDSLYSAEAAELESRLAVLMPAVRERGCDVGAAQPSPGLSGLSGLSGLERREAILKRIAAHGKQCCPHLPAVLFFSGVDPLLKALKAADATRQEQADHDGTASLQKHEQDLRVLELATKEGKDMVASIAWAFAKKTANEVRIITVQIGEALAAATGDSKSRELPKLVSSKPEPEQADVRSNGVVQAVEDLHQRHDYAATHRGGEVLHHSFACPAFRGSLLTSPPCITPGTSTPMQGLYIGSGVWRNICSSSSVSEHSADAQELLSHKRPKADRYYAMSTQIEQSATSLVQPAHTAQDHGQLTGGDLGDIQREPYAGQVTILLQEPIHVTSVKVVTVMATIENGDFTPIPHCTPRAFRLVGWTEDPRSVRDVRGKQFQLGTHMFHPLQPSLDYDSGNSGDSESSDGGATSQVWEQQYPVPIEYDGVTIPALKAVTVHVLSNYGENEFTCLHRVQIIGVPEK